MRWRSPRSSAEPVSFTDEEDGSPQSILLSVSEVQTAAFAEMRLGNLTHHEVEPDHRNLPVNPSIRPKPVGGSLARPTRSAIPPKPVLKMIVKREVKVKKEDVKSDGGNWKKRIRSSREKERTRPRM